MRLSLFAGALLVLASCGPKALTLPEAPVDRAATCGVVAAAEARAATGDIKASLPFEAQGRILHFALLAGAEGEEFGAEAANAVLTRMPELEGEITSGKWQELVPECRAAFPATQIATVALPADAFAAQLACDELGDFLTTALARQDGDYGSQLGDYHRLARSLDRRLGPGLRARAGPDLAAQQRARRGALADAASGGPPMAVMQRCLERFD
jgi:hypothetical protein